MTKIVAIGVGSSVFGVELLRDVFQQRELEGADLALVDLDAARLDTIRQFAGRLNEASDLRINVTATTDRAEALPGATFVVTSVAVDRERTWKLDHELALKHGFPSVLSENAGPGGLSHTLRSIPLTLSIARDVERLAPDALLLNYTNPENRVCLAIRRYTGVQAIGLCHGVANTALWMAERVLGRGLDDVELRAAGVNHFTWTMSICDAAMGTDLEPEFRERLGELPPEEWRLCRYLYDRFGIFPTTGDNHVGEHLAFAAEMIGTDGYDFEGFAQRKDAGWANVEAWAAGAKPVEPLLQRPSHEARVNLSAGRIMADVVSGRKARKPSFIVPNDDGLIANVSRDAAVEVPGVIASGKARGESVGELPGAVVAMVQTEVEIQKLAVDAAVQGSRDLAMQALLLDPIVHSARAAEAFLDDILSVHARYLP